MERRQIVFVVIFVLSGILFLVGYNQRAKDEQEKSQPKGNEAKVVQAKSITVTKGIAEDLVQLGGTQEQNELFTSVISTSGAALKSVVLMNKQYWQADRTDGAPEYVPKDRLVEGPYELVSTWDPRYYPFRLVIKQLQWEDDAGQTTLEIHSPTNWESTDDDRSRIRLKSTGNKQPYTILKNDRVDIEGNEVASVLSIDGDVLQLNKPLPETISKNSQLRVVRRGTPMALFNDARTAPQFTQVESSSKGGAVFVWPNPNSDVSDVWIQRHWSVSDSYKMNHKVQFINMGSKTLTLKYSMDVVGWVDPQREEPSMFTMPPKPWTPVCYVDQSYEEVPPTELLEESGSKVFNGNVNWYGITSQYFTLVAIIGNESGVPGSCTLRADANGVIGTSFEKATVVQLPGTRSACLPDWFPVEKRPNSVRCSDAMKALGVDEKHLDEASLDIALDRFSGDRKEAIRLRTMLLAYGSFKGNGSFSVSIFGGPKDLDLLKQTGPAMEKALDFGWLSVLAVPLLELMKFFHSWVLNWAIAIVLLTIFIRLLMFPLTQKSFVQMQKMQQLKPEMEAVQKKHGNDKERLHKEMMNLYKRHGVNPLGGCLPMVLQMPVWFALYRMIYAAVDLYQAPLFLWISDMTQPDPYFVLPVLLGVFFFIQQLFTPTAPTGDQTQQKIMKYAMPVMFSVFMLFLPAGLVFYIFISTLFGIGQQWFIRRKYATVDPASGRSKAA